MKPIIITFEPTVFAANTLKEIWPDEAEQLLNSPNFKNFIRIINQSTVEVINLPIIIGRDRDTANFIITGGCKTISRVHATIFDDKGTVKIKDLKSKYGTMIVNRNIIVTRGTGTELKEGDLIKLSDSVELRISFKKPGILSRIKSWFT